MRNNKTTPSGIKEKTWKNMIQEIETVVENYYPRGIELDSKQHFTQMMEVIAMYIGGAIQESFGTLTKKEFISLVTEMYDKMSESLEEETLH